MKLLNEIVDLLMSETGSLNEALLRTKVLLHDIGQRQLATWVTSELQGYKDQDEVPRYRTTEARVFGNVTNGVYIYARRPVSVAHLEQSTGTSLANTSMRQAIGVLEKYVVDAEPSAALVRHLGPQWDYQLSKAYSDGYYVEGAYSSIPISEVRQILIEVRSRLLDFILELRDEVGTTSSADEVKEKANNLDVPAMFEKNVFGDNTTFVFGTGNNPQVTNTVIKNDKQALAQELREHGVAEDDIAALDIALAEDPTPTVPAQYGPAVRGWMTRMLGKAVDGSWNLSVGAAGSLLATVIQRYYGL